jgi:caffeoyl-CoA O-methyltransferase
MLKFLPEGIQEYAERHVAAEPPLLAELSTVTNEKTEWPEMKISRYQGVVMQMLLTLIGARRVLELGTFTGYSALTFAEVLPEGGQVVTLDVDPKNTAIAREFWARSPHGKKIELKLGKAIETIKTVTGPFDAAFIDADKVGYASYYEAVFPLVRPGGLIMLDNMLSAGDVLTLAGESGKAIAKVNDAIAKDARVESVILTIRDGLTVARKK